MKRLILASRTGGDDVDLGADGTPIAFRIWSAGDNPTDMGVHRFTATSARLLMEEQDRRGNLYSFDVDHMSVGEDAPPRSRIAVGFHRLAVRNGDLWATDVDLADWIRAGIAKNPPEWKYFSPAYTVDPETSEITSYLNTALTNNPATWSVTALASRGSKKGTGMDYKTALAALMGDDEEKKEAAKKAMKAAFGDDDGDGDEKKDKPEAKKASESAEPEKKEEMKKASESDSSESDDKEEKKATAALASKVAELLSERESDKRAKILASRKDLTKDFIKSVSDLPIDVMQKVIDATPVATVNPAAASQVQATRGSGQTGSGGLGVRATRLPPEEHQALLSKMGREGPPKPPTLERDEFGGVSHVFRQMPQTAARQFAANHRFAKIQGLEVTSLPEDIGATFGGGK